MALQSGKWSYTNIIWSRWFRFSGTFCDAFCQRAAHWSQCLYEHEAAETIVIRHLVIFHEPFYLLGASILGGRGKNNLSKNVSDGRKNEKCPAGGCHGAVT